MSDEIVYVCNRCGETFSLEEGRTLHLEEGDITLCPNCRSDDIEEGERCKVCRGIHYTFDLSHGCVMTASPMRWNPTNRV